MPRDQNDEPQPTPLLPPDREHIEYLVNALQQRVGVRYFAPYEPWRLVSHDYWQAWFSPDSHTTVSAAIITMESGAKRLIWGAHTVDRLLLGVERRQAFTWLTSQQRLKRAPDGREDPDRSIYILADGTVAGAVADAGRLAQVLIDSQLGRDMHLTVLAKYGKDPALGGGLDLPDSASNYQVLMFERPL